MDSRTKSTGVRRHGPRAPVSPGSRKTRPVVVVVPRGPQPALAQKDRRDHHPPDGRTPSPLPPATAPGSTLGSALDSLRLDSDEGGAEAGEKVLIEEEGFPHGRKAKRIKRFTKRVKS